MEAQEPRQGLVLSLSGTFRLQTHDGTQLPVAGEYPKRLYRDSGEIAADDAVADQLIDLLWDNNKGPGSSLRQLRHQLSHLIGPHGASVTAVGNVLTLNGVTEQTTTPPHRGWNSSRMPVSAPKLSKTGSGPNAWP